MSMKERSRIRVARHGEDSVGRFQQKQFLTKGCFLQSHHSLIEEDFEEVCRWTSLLGVPIIAIKEGNDLNLADNRKDNYLVREATH